MATKGLQAASNDRQPIGKSSSPDRVDDLLRSDELRAVRHRIASIGCPFADRPTVSRTVTALLLLVQCGCVIPSSIVAPVPVRTGVRSGTPTGRFTG
jgi:hypothetical protein